MSNVTDSFDMVEVGKFMVDPVTSWTLNQALLFPWLFIIPAEFLAGISSFLVYALGPKADGSRPGLPRHPKGKEPALHFYPDYCYVYFNRLVMLPFISWLIVTVVWNSKAVVYDMNDMTLLNTLVGFAVVFSLSDLCYYTGHRIVHMWPAVYKFVHKHHHGESAPIHGWFDTCNAHPTDFFYTGFATSPMSCLWLMPAGSVHIVAIALCLWINSFVGALGHCRLDLNWGVFNTRFHAGHHAYSKCNFAQNIELWDRLFGTYKELKMPGSSSKGSKAAKAQ